MVYGPTWMAASSYDKSRFKIPIEQIAAVLPVDSFEN